MPDWPLQRDCIGFYGDPRQPEFYDLNIWYVYPPFPMVYIDDAGTKKAVQKIPIHKYCATSLARVLLKVWEACSGDVSKIERIGANIFSGSYNYRPMRGSSILSMHAFGAAIDFDAQANPYNSAPRFCRYSAEHPTVQAFKSEGWIWGGDWLSPRDAMHFQAARVR